jgi:hypothetical protein
MPYRFTNTDKWNDAWFSNLKPNEKLLFIYLYENCDMAGFIELNEKRWSIDIGITQGTIKGAIKGLGRGLIISETNDCLFIRNYLKHQKNLPLIPEKNPAHRGILKSFENYKHKFKIENINEFIEGACKGLGSPLGNGNGNGNGKKGSKKFVKPELSEVKNYFSENGYSEEAAETAYKYYDTANWIDSQGNHVRNWKQKMIAVWFKPENLIKPDKKLVDGYY